MAAPKRQPSPQARPASQRLRDEADRLAATAALAERLENAAAARKAKPGDAKARQAHIDAMDAYAQHRRRDRLAGEQAGRRRPLTATTGGR